MEKKAVKTGYLTPVLSGLVVAAAVVLVLAAVPARAGGTVDAGGTGEVVSSSRPYFTDMGQYNYARFLMHEEDFKAAAREFGRLIEEFPSSPLLAEAQFRMAECQLNSGLVEEAEKGLELFLSNFAESSFAPQAVMLLGEARDKLGKTKLDRWPERLPVPAKLGMRAVQVSFFDGETLEEVAREMRVLRSSGVDTVIVRVFHNRGDRYYPIAKRAGAPSAGVYYSTSAAPVVADLLGPFTELAHAEGLNVFAWMTTRYADYGAEGREDLACKAYDLDSGGFEECKGLDLFNPEAVERIEELYRDLGAYDIDGVLFQDDLVLRHTEGFGPYAEKLFRAETGVELDPARLYIPTSSGAVHYTTEFWRWAAWKNKRLLEVASRAKRAVREANPEAEFAINLMYENLTNAPYALAWLSQNLHSAFEEDFDYYSIMAYHRQIEQELDKDPESVKAMIEEMAATAARAVGDPGKVLLKFQTVDWATGEPLPDSEVVELIRDIESGKARNISLAVFPYRRDFPFYELGRTPGLASVRGR